MSAYLIPILVFAVPVMVVVSLALLTGRTLKGSCGGMAPDGSCPRCGKPAAEIPADRSGSGPCN